MRIVVLGDFHIHKDEFDLTRQAIDDINGCSPDLVVPLGDFGCNATIGGVEGLEQAYGFLRRLEAPLRPILGNHDMQRETGQVGLQPKGTMEKAFLSTFELDSTNGVLEYEGFRLFFIGTDLQPEDSCYMEQECYVTDEHFSWLIGKLRERPGVPCIFFTHAPPMGAGLRTVPRVHVRATNAYLDQNHRYGRWMELIREFPAIKLWFSAHYHLGHDHADSSSVRSGTRFFITGVHGSCTRDGLRQSRIIDIHGDKVSVSTLDHNSRLLRLPPDWFGSLRASAAPEDEPSLKAADQNGLRLVSSFPIGDEPAIPEGIVPIDEDRCLVASRDGFLWEIRPELQAVIGTLHLGLPLTAAANAEDGIWRTWSSKLVRSPKNSPWRFQRHKAEESYPEMIELEHPAVAIAPRAGGGIWLGAGNELSFAEQGRMQTVGGFESEIRSLVADGLVLYVLLRNGDLFKLPQRKTKKAGIELVGRQIVCWDSLKGHAAGVRRSESGYSILYFTSVGQSVEVTLSVPSLESYSTAEPTAQIIMLQPGRVLLRCENEVFLWNGIHSSPLKLELGEQIVHAASRPADMGEAEWKFWLCTSSRQLRDKPQLQLWACEVPLTPAQ
ncbi:metallophosphoesterase family protein [Paenibacillus koleovorans]|uniref:metallophosphoesterase family protein n=1 Tax=Paenibacillus koleovorans TaxID=121608 RepID=UPI0013E36CC6|nr:metallophosphoesterase [Paenibacillus koleovorans]